MDCKTFRNGIDAFKSRPLLYQALIRKHIKDNPNCSCNVKEIE